MKRYPRVSSSRRKSLNALLDRKAKVDCLVYRQRRKRRKKLCNNAVNFFAEFQPVAELRSYRTKNAPYVADIIGRDESEICWQNKAPKNQSLREKLRVEGGVDSLYIDLNSMFHTIFNNEDETADGATMLESMRVMLLKKIEDQVIMLMPKRLLYLCFGVPSIAKIPEQRKRRWKTFIDDEIKLLTIRLENVKLDNKADDVQINDFVYRCEVSPGTDFMLDLADYIKAQIAEKMVHKDEQWTGFKIVFSDTNEPGEGEHKIINHINRCPSQSIGSRAIYSKVSDSRFLALLTHRVDSFVYYPKCGKSEENTKETTMVVDLRKKDEGMQRYEFQDLIEIYKIGFDYLTAFRSFPETF